MGSSSVLAKSFEQQDFFKKSKFDFLFPGNQLDSIYRIFATQLDDRFRPSSWSKRVPFGLCIDQTQKRAFYVSYRSFFKRDILEIDLSTVGQLEDVCSDAFGHIYITDYGLGSVHRAKKSTKTYLSFSPKTSV